MTPVSGSGRTVTLGRAAIAVSVAAVMVLGYLSYRLFEDAAALRAAPQDNVQWSLSRLEVETLRFAVALSDPGSGLPNLRKRYDVFFSRVDLLRAGDLFSPLRADPVSAAELARFTDFLDRATPLIDGPDGALEAGRADLLSETQGLRAAAASLSLRGNALFNQRAEARRTAFERLSLGAAIVAFALIVLLSTTLLVLYSRSRLAARTQQKAAASDARLAAIAGVALDPIIVADAGGRIIEYNDAAQRVFGYSRSEAIGQEMSELFIPHEMREAHRQGMKRYLATRDPHVVGMGRIELEALRKTGERFPVELAVGEARETEDGEPIFVGFMRDISRRKATEADLTEARDAAMAADHAKSDFIAVMSHEMRTPLNGMMGGLELLGGTRLDEKQAEFVDVATRSGEILLRHINDVLDISRIEAGRLEIADEALDLAAILDEVAAVARPRAMASDVEIEVEATLDAAPRRGDTRRIQQVLLNLVGNAVKFAPEGRVKISATQVGATDGGDKIEFSVTDNGVGIAEEDLDRVFDDFVTLDAGYDRQSGGAGLGLAICRRIVSAMGGEIGVESRLGAGSRFWFTLPLQRSAPNDGAKAHLRETPAVTPPSPSALSALEVLLVEDNEVNRLVARNMLAEAGHTVVEACDGLEGVQRAAARRFDVILMDISMPRMDGIEATKQILAEGASMTTPVIGLTAHASPGEQAQFFEAGMVACLTKPLRRKALREVLTAHAAGGAAPAADAAGAERPVIDEEVFDEFFAALPGDLGASTLARVCEEFSQAARDLAETPPAELSKAAHKVAGSAALVGAVEAHATLAYLQDEASAGRPTDAALFAAQAALRRAVDVLREFGQ